MKPQTRRHPHFAIQKRRRKISLYQASIPKTKSQNEKEMSEE